MFAVRQDRNLVEVNFVLDDLLARGLIDGPVWPWVLDGLQYPPEELALLYIERPREQRPAAADTDRDLVLGPPDVLEEEGLAIELVSQSGDLILRRDIPGYVPQVSGPVKLTEEASQTRSNLTKPSRLEPARPLLI